MLLKNLQLHEGAHLPHIARQAHDAAATATEASATSTSKRSRRYLLKRSTMAKPRVVANNTFAMLEVFGKDKLGETTTARFLSALQQGNYGNYNSILRSFLKFCDVFYVDPMSATPVDIARYLARLGERGMIAAIRLQPYFLAISRYL
jgi:hypothetical protein